jgi:hypothetical protein
MAMSDQSEKRGCNMAEAAYVLRDALAVEAIRTAFVAAYRGTAAGQRLRRGLARLLANDPATMAFFDNLISCSFQGTAFALRIDTLTRLNRKSGAVPGSMDCR